MSSITAQQTKLDLELVPKEKRLEIGKCNGRLNPGKIQRESTFQVVLDALALTLCYSAFLITADVPEEEIQTQSGNLQRYLKRICPMKVTEVLSEKTTGLDKLCLSRAQILWGMYHQKNVDYVKLLWEDFIYQIDNRAYKNKEKCVLTPINLHQVIIHYFLTQDKTVSWRNKIRMHTSKDDYLINTLRFVSAKEATQIYGVVLPESLTSPEMKESKAYKTYLVSPEEPTGKSKRVKRPGKKSTKAPTRGVVIRETFEMPLSKKKEKMTLEKRKGIDLLSEVALTEEAQYEDARQKRTGVKPGFPDVTEEESSKSKAKSWGNDEDVVTRNHLHFTMVTKKIILEDMKKLNTLGTTPEGGVLLGPERPRTYEDLSDTEKKRYDADVRAINIVLQGLPKDIYKLINHNIEAKAIWDNVKMLLADDQGDRIKSEIKDLAREWCSSTQAMGAHRIELRMKMQDKMLLMQAQENGAVLDEEELLFLAGEQDNTFDANVDNQPVQDLALNEDNIFQADECDAFDSDLDDEPTAQSIFIANLSSAGLANPQAGLSNASILSKVHILENAIDNSVTNLDEHEIHNEVQQPNVIDSNSVDVGNSNVIPYEQYLSVDNISVVPSTRYSSPMIRFESTTDSWKIRIQSEEENKLEMADTQAEIILSQGLPRHIFNNLNQTSTAKEIWDNVEMLMQGSEAYEPHAKKTLKKQEQSTSIVDPLAYVAHTTTAPVLPSPSTSSPQPTAQSSNDALMATMTQIANLLSGFQKQFPPTNNQLWTSSNSRNIMLRYAPQQECDMLQLQGKDIITDGAKEKGDVLDAEAEAFLADVECTAPYDQPQALTTTNK
ncbi:hypothetical protein Tco_0105619 [Tanacetum coccineum]